MIIFIIRRKNYSNKIGPLQTSDILPLPFCHPFSITNVIEKYQRDFLWGKNKESKGPHLIDWEEVCKPKMSGRLGIKGSRM